MKDIKVFIKERDEVLNQYDLKIFKDYASKRGTVFTSDEVCEIAFHKCITGALNVKSEYREQSHNWLISRGYGSWK